MYEHNWDPEYGRRELKAKDLHWLQRAARERGLQSYQMKRVQIIELLLRWQDDQTHDEELA